MLYLHVATITAKSTTEAIQIKGYGQQVYRLLPHEYSCSPITRLLFACGCCRPITVLLLAFMNIHDLIWTDHLVLICTLRASHIAVQLPMFCMASVVQIQHCRL